MKILVVTVKNPDFSRTESSKYKNHWYMHTLEPKKSKLTK